MKSPESILQSVTRTCVATIFVASSLMFAACRHEPEDKTPASWKQFVAMAESQEAPYFKTLAVDLKEHEMSYEWVSSNYDLKQNRGEIRVLLTRPNKNPLKVGFLFEREDGEWKNTNALDYTNDKAWP